MCACDTRFQRDTTRRTSRHIRCDTPRHATPRHAACARSRVCVRVTAYAKENGQREREKRERRRGPHVFASSSTRTQVHFDGRTDGRTEDGRVAADRSVPILVRLSTSLSLRNRTKPVSRHFGANQWRTGAARWFSSLSLSLCLSTAALSPRSFPPRQD